MSAPDGPVRRRMRPREAAVIALPNGFTLANLFFGIFGIVAASRGDFDAAARFIVFGGIADALDGRIARATKSGSRFGEELDSLVDAISFGTAPALIMYFAVFQSSRWEWIFCFFFTAMIVSSSSLRPPRPCASGRRPSRGTCSCGTGSTRRSACRPP